MQPICVVSRDIQLVLRSSSFILKTKDLIMSTKHLAKDSVCPDNLSKYVPRFYTMRFCPFAHRVALVAAIKDIPMDYVYINLKDKPSWYLEKCPRGTVPSIEINDQMIIDSLICSQFLDDVYPKNKLTSTDPYKKARHGFLLQEFGRFSATVAKLKSNYSEDIVNECLEILQSFENELVKEKETFFGGNQIGMLDLMIWPWFERFAPMQNLGIKFMISESRFPHLCKWQQKMFEEDGIKKVSIDGKHYINYIKSQASGNPVYDP